MLVLWPRNTIERFLTCDLAEAIAVDLSWSAVRIATQSHELCSVK
jgi:hypothetical protein